MQTNTIPSAIPHPMVNGALSPGLDLLVLKSRLTASARCLLEGMGIEVTEASARGVMGPAMYRLYSPQPCPRVYWLDSQRADDLVEALKEDEDRARSPDWVHSLLRTHRAGALRDLDGGIDFGDYGLGADLVLHDLLGYPTL